MKNTNFIKTDDNKPLSNELIFSFVNTIDYRQNSYSNSIKTKLNNIYFPGDKWLYVNFF